MHMVAHRPCDRKHCAEENHKGAHISYSYGNGQGAIGFDFLSNRTGLR